MANEWGKNQYEYGESSRANEDNDDGDDHERQIPPGFRFCPTNEELICYLTCKLKGLNSPECKHIEEVDIYAYSPMELSEKYKLDRENEWYFFTPRSKKYPNGERPDRFAKNGYWKPTASGKPVREKRTGKKIGNVRTLSFRTGFEKDKTDRKSKWLMHEYTLERHPNTPTPVNDKMFDKWVLVKIYRKRGASNVAEVPEEEVQNDIKEAEQIAIFDAPQPHDVEAYMAAAPQNLRLQPPQIVEELQNQSLLWAPTPIHVIEPAHASSLEYFNDMSLLNNPNYGFSVAFSAEENQQIPPPPQTFGLNGTGTAAPHPYGQLNGTPTMAPHPDGQSYGQQIFGLNGTPTVAPHPDGQFYGQQIFGLNGTPTIVPQTVGVDEIQTTASLRGDGFNGVADQNLKLDQVNIDGPDANLASHGNDNLTGPNPANNNEEDDWSWLEQELDFNFADVDDLISTNLPPLVGDFVGNNQSSSYPPPTLP